MASIPVLTGVITVLVERMVCSPSTRVVVSMVMDPVSTSHVVALIRNTGKVVSSHLKVLRTMISCSASPITMVITAMSILAHCKLLTQGSCSSWAVNTLVERVTWV